MRALYVLLKYRKICSDICKQMSPTMKITSNKHSRNMSLLLNRMAWARIYETFTKEEMRYIQFLIKNNNTTSMKVHHIKLSQYFTEPCTPAKYMAVPAWNLHWLNDSDAKYICSDIERAIKEKNSVWKYCIAKALLGLNGKTKECFTITEYNREVNRLLTGFKRLGLTVVPHWANTYMIDWAYHFNKSFDLIKKQKSLPLKYIAAGAISSSLYYERDNKGLENKIYEKLKQNPKSALKYLKILRRHGEGFTGIKYFDLPRMLFQYIKDGKRIYENYTWQLETRSKYPGINFPSIDYLDNCYPIDDSKDIEKALMTSIHNHRIERESKRSGLDFAMPVPEDFVEQLQPYVLKTGIEMENAGRELGHCISSYASPEESKYVFLRNKTVCLQLDWVHKSIVQCFDARNKMTKESRAFEKFVRQNIAEIKSRKLVGV